MNVDGMPWYTGRSDDRKAAGMKDTESTPGPEDRGGNSERKEKISLNTKESFALMRGVLSAALLIGVIFFVGLALFILFCIYVWFK
jgi:hypothetical protein